MVFYNPNCYNNHLNQLLYQLKRIFSPKMTNVLKPPDHVYQMKKLDKTQFTKVIQVPVLHLKNIRISEVLPLIKKVLLKVDKLRPIKQLCSESTHVYLNPNVISTWTDLPQETRVGLESLKLSDVNLKTEELTLSYENFSPEAVFQAVLPKDLEGFSSYTTVGHIVHVNLREHLIPYKNLIGRCY